MNVETPDNSGVSTRKGGEAPTVEVPVGPELDAAVAERVMGYRWWRTTLRYSTEVRRALCHPEFKNDEWQLADGTEEAFTGSNPFLPFYSTSWAAAMDVVAKMQADGWKVEMTDDSCETIMPWFVSFFRSDEKHFEIHDSGAETLPEAICRAALAAVGQEETPMS